MNNQAIFERMAQMGAPAQGGMMPPATGPAMPSQPAMPPQGGMPSSSPMPGGGMPPIPPGASPQGGPQAPQISPQMIMQMLSKMGRNGDSLMAHLTPGEIQVPPEVQSPKVLATLDKEFGKKGVSVDQFTAGSPQSSVNPNTQTFEYNFMSAILPIALGLAGNMFLPGMGTGLSAAAAGAVGSGAGTALGGLLTGQKPLQAALSGVGAGAGGYLLGGMGKNAANAAANTPMTALSDAGNPMSTTPALMAGKGATTMTPPSPSALNLWGALPRNIDPMGAAGSAIGGYVGGAFGAPSPKPGATYVNGFNDRMPAVKDLPAYNDLLGTTSYKGPTPDFTGYNPLAPNAPSYDFFRGA